MTHESEDDEDEWIGGGCMCMRMMRDGVEEAAWHKDAPKEPGARLGISPTNQLLQTINEHNCT